jgi:hypothetical protein
LARKSGSSEDGQDFERAVDRLRREAAPALAKALDLDRAEAAEAALNAMAEVALAARAFVRALPMPPASRVHLENAEREALRAARLAVASVGKAKRGRKGKRGAALKEVQVDFGRKAAAPSAPKRAGKAAAKRRAR